MLREKIRRWTSEHPNTTMARLLMDGNSWLYQLNLYLATCVGNIPCHSVRNIFYRAVLKLELPRDSIIYWKCRFFYPRGIAIGNHTIIGNDAFLDGRGGLTIGSNVNIAGEARIFTAEHDPFSPTFIEGVTKSVSIGDYVYIGSRVTILPGAIIGEGAVVASGAVVAGTVAPWTMVGGVPAKFIKARPVVKYTLNTKQKMLFQ